MDLDLEASMVRERERERGHPLQRWKPRRVVVVAGWGEGGETRGWKPYLRAQSVWCVATCGEHSCSSAHACGIVRTQTRTQTRTRKQAHIHNSACVVCVGGWLEKEVD